jgi:hypothetical protein
MHVPRVLYVPLLIIFRSITIPITYYAKLLFFTREPWRSDQNRKDGSIQGKPNEIMVFPGRWWHEPNAEDGKKTT